jgi:hypothetical protein
MYPPVRAMLKRIQRVRVSVVKRSTAEMLLTTCGEPYLSMLATVFLLYSSSMADAISVYKDGTDRAAGKACKTLPLILLLCSTRPWVVLKELKCSTRI